MMQQRIHVNIRNKMHSLLWYTMKPHHFWFVHVASIEGREHTLKMHHPRFREIVILDENY